MPLLAFGGAELRGFWLLQFTEVDLRLMLERATGFRPDVVDDRFVVETRFRAASWEVVVEPDEVEHLLVVVTAYPVEP
jgi:hypothetical protein